MLTLLSLSLMTASANTETACAPTVPQALCVMVTRPAPPVRIEMGRVTFDSLDMQQYALVEDNQDFLRLVPGASRGFLGGNSPGEVAVMLDGVVLLNNKRLSPLP